MHLIREEQKDKLIHQSNEIKDLKKIQNTFTKLINECRNSKKQSRHSRKSNY